MMVIHGRTYRSNAIRGSVTRRTDEHRQELYTDRWAKASRHHRALHPLCELCLWEGNSTPATEVDHIIPHCGNAELFWQEDNWQSLCRKCHSHKSWRESVGLSADWIIKRPHVIVSGKPGSGKTEASLHNAKNGTIVWDMDEVANTLQFVEYPRPQWQLARLLASRQEMLRKMRESNTPIVIMIVSSMHQGHAIAKDLACRWHVCVTQYDTMTSSWHDEGGGVVT